MKFKVLDKNRFELGNYAVVPFRDEDKYEIKVWRNQQMDVLRQKELLTDKDQENYYASYILPSFSLEYPRIMLFSFLENEKCIGYGGLTNIDWESKRIELSFLMNHERAVDIDLYRKDFTTFLTLMKKIVFEELKFNRMFTETYDRRPLHIQILEENGFRPEGRMKEHVLIDGVFTDSLLHGFIKKDYYA
jgi:RimJ/RimL family protein N-acetyltransferase